MSNDKVFESLDRSFNDKKEELRVSLGEYNGKTFASLRVFFKGTSGDMIPSKTGVTVRAKEIRKVIEALQRVESELTGEVPPPAPEMFRQDDDVPF